jgi:hypothetical protein
VAKQTRRSAEGKRADYAKGTRGELQRLEVGLHDLHPSPPHSTHEVTEPLGPHGIELDGDHLDFALGEFEGDRAETGPYFDDELPAAEVRLVDQAPGAFRTKEILAETATPRVSICTCLGGHGGSRPWAFLEPTAGLGGLQSGGA